MLNFNGNWRFESPGSIAHGVVGDFADLIGKITTQGDVQRVLELFKSYFAGASGTSSGWSSNASWAETDLHRHMNDAAANAPLFIEAFYDGCETLRKEGVAVPDVRIIKKVLTKHNTGFEIQPPNLVSRSAEIASVEVPPHPPSLDEQARNIIQTSLSDGSQLLSEGRDRQAVQELLWLLETVSTAFQGLNTGTGNSTIEGKYFNKIVVDLRRYNQGTTLDRVLTWITALHGYLSSPTGGGIRHGAHLKEGIATKPGEAQLFCNLIRSYISYLLIEHERLAAAGSVAS